LTIRRQVQIGSDLFTTIKRERQIVAFAKGMPQFSYRTAYTAIKDRIELQIDLETALRIASRKGCPAGRIQNKELIQAFFDYDEVRRYSASNPIDFDTEYFRASREVLVPIAPLSIIRERSQFVPIFACGWNSNPLNITQRRLLMTIYEDAFLSLTNYQKSPAEVLFFPKSEDANEGKLRRPEVWRRGDYGLLTRSELNRCVEIFVSARELARKALLDELEEMRKRDEQEEALPVADMGDLFEKK
jgi:hypothetical protein